MFSCVCFEPSLTRKIYALQIFVFIFIKNNNRDLSQEYTHKNTKTQKEARLYTNRHQVKKNLKKDKKTQKKKIDRTKRQDYTQRDTKVNYQNKEARVYTKRHKEEDRFNKEPKVYTIRHKETPR